MASQVSRFSDALARHGVRLVETAPESFADALADVVTEPAVGTPLPDPLDYGGTPVATDPSVTEIEGAATGVTRSPLGIAASGSVVVRGTEDGAEPVSLFADHHVAVLPESNLVPDVAAAIDDIAAATRTGRGDNVIATGPSATADMGDLVVGAHGPKRVTVLLVSGVNDEGNPTAGGVTAGADS
jgi:L-lactate dehydrogenase complex protein LldG